MNPRKRRQEAAAWREMNKELSETLNGNLDIETAVKSCEVIKKNKGCDGSLLCAECPGFGRNRKDRIDCHQKGGWGMGFGMQLAKCLDSATAFIAEHREVKS